jgi:hypothetical protein
MAQFRVVPSLKKIAVIFKEATGMVLEVGITWKEWKELSRETLESLRPYYRPCHIHILEETESEKYENPCTLLRQLLRPHGLRISVKHSEWKLCTETIAGIKKHDGLILDWK